MKKSRRTSGGKRTSIKTKKVIQKKKKAFRLKARKNAKKLLSLGIKPRKLNHKTLSVPNLCPFKKDLLKSALKKRNDLKLELIQKKLEKKDRQNMITKAQQNINKNKINQGLMVPKSLRKTSWYFDQQKNDLVLPSSNYERKLMYMKELNSVINNSDILIEVLDGRDPNGCRSIEIENRIIKGKSLILNSNKKLILLINKIDLIPNNILKKWIKILRNEYPVIAFKCSTQEQKKKLYSNIKYNKVNIGDNKNRVGNLCVGANALMNLLQNYAKNLNIKVPITVGFIGYPNTGKSSVINSLKRRQCVGVGNTPGFTKNLQIIKLDNNIKLIDSPGVILNENNEDESRLVLRNALKIQDINPYETLQYIFNVVNHKSLLNIYNINTKKSKYNKLDLFLKDFCDAQNLFAKGGIPDLNRACDRIIYDWNNGKIPFYVSPPETFENMNNIKIVNQFSKEFDIDGLINNYHDKLMNVEKNNDNNNKKDGNKKFLIIDENKFVIHNNDNDNDDDMKCESGDDQDMNENENEIKIKPIVIDDEIKNTHAFLNN